jgi:hypothetical protein
LQAPPSQSPVRTACHLCNWRRLERLATRHARQPLHPHLQSPRASRPNDRLCTGAAANDHPGRSQRRRRIGKHDQRDGEPGQSHAVFDVRWQHPASCAAASRDGLCVCYGRAAVADALGCRHADQFDVRAL